LWPLILETGLGYEDLSSQTIVFWKDTRKYRATCRVARCVL